MSPVHPYNPIVKILSKGLRNQILAAANVNVPTYADD